MESLPDTLLINAYEKAIELNLQREFIKMIEKELKRRGLKTKLYLKRPQHVSMN